MYFPFLALAPAEMVALEELPERDKDALTPVFQLKSWLSSTKLDKTFDRIEKSYGKRSAFLLPPDLVPNPQNRPIIDEVNGFLDPKGGFDAWCQLFESGRAAQHIPALQLTDAAEFDAQAARLVALGRGVVVSLSRAAFAFIPAIARRTAQHTSGGANVTFLLDLKRQTRTLLLQEAELTTVIDNILAICPKAKISITASSFPDSFAACSSQEIYERSLFQSLRYRFPKVLIFSDRGSARAEKPGGGGGVPYPRVDYPEFRTWLFFRTEESRPYKGGYTELARQLVDECSAWDPAVRVWGTQMIEKTKLGDPDGISSPARSTAVRINLHLHRQLWFDEPSQIYETDDDWHDL